MDRMLFIYDNSTLQQSLDSFLAGRFSICHARPDAAKSIISQFQPDIVVFHLEKIFETEGLLKELRESFKDHAFKTVSLISATDDKVLGYLDAIGINAWEVLPLDLSSFYWRCKALLKKTEDIHQTVAKLSLGSITVFPKDECVALSNGQKIFPAPVQMKLLVAFASYPNKLLTRDWLKLKVWNNEPISNRSIDAQISKLKRLLPDLETIIENIYGHGYMAVLETSVENSG